MTYSHIFLVLSVGLFFSGCSSLESSREEMSRVELSYQPSGSIRYLLPDIPQWAHASSSGSCFKSSPLRYLDFNALRSSFQLSYTDAVQFQLLYNTEFRKLQLMAFQGVIPVRDEEILFFRVSDMIKSRIVPFVAPTYQRVHFIHIDDFFDKPENIRQLLILMNSDKMNKGHPVFVSVCRRSDEIEAFLLEHNLQNQNIRILSSEMFSSFGLENELRPLMRINLDLFFNESQQLFFYSPTRSLPFEIEGNVKVEAF
jgi:hypothetical protein